MIDKSRSIKLLTINLILLCLLTSGCTSMLKDAPIPYAFISSLGKLLIPPKTGDARIAQDYPKAEKISKEWSGDASLVTIGFVFRYTGPYPVDSYRPTCSLFVYHSSRKNKDLMIWQQQGLPWGTQTTEGPDRPGDSRAMTGTAWTDIAESLALKEILVSDDGLPVQHLDPNTSKVDLVDVVGTANKKTPAMYKKGGQEMGDRVICILARPRGENPKWYVGYVSGDPQYGTGFIQSFVFDARSGKLIEQRDLLDNPTPGLKNKDIYWWSH